MTGEWLGQAGWPDPLRERSRLRDGGRIHQFLWRCSRTVSHAKRNLAVRIDEKPIRPESSSAGRFRACANRSDPEGQWLLLRTSTVQDAMTG